MAQRLQARYRAWYRLLLPVAVWFALLVPLVCVLHCHAARSADAGAGLGARHLFCDPAGSAASHPAERPPISFADLRAFALLVLVAVAAVAAALRPLAAVALMQCAFRTTALPPPLPPPRRV